MASGISTCSCLTVLSVRHKTHRSLQVKAQSFKDEARSSPMIDQNMSILRGRIEEVKIKERLERCLERGYGWNYAPGYDYKAKRERALSELFECLCVAGGTIGFTFFGGTVFLCLLSLLYHLN
ncbi:hypothetical protein RJ641_023187 [Dillenia turbinata]|uniref:Uncharacterized protein n=1 Tax=Dillenia turbinata TaxID=194707 RepID=A0AAN8ULW0_9MAGN